MKQQNTSWWSIRTRLILFFLFFTATITTSHFLTRNSFDELEKYRLVLKKASQNRDLIEEIIIHAQDVIDNQPQATVLLLDNIAKFQVNLDILKNGGNEILEGKNVQFLPCDEMAEPQLLRLEKLWYPFRTKGEILANDENWKKNVDNQQSKERGEEVVRNMERQRVDLLIAQSEFTEQYQNISQSKQEATNAWLWGLWGSNLLLLFTGYYIIQLLLLNPLTYFTQVAQKIGRGDLSQKITYQSKNEIGLVADALNNMVDKIGNATNFIKNIETGNLDVVYNKETQDENLENDNLANALLSMRNRMKSVAEEEEERNWVTRGQAMFGEILQKFNDDTKSLSYEIISNLVKYLNANQGGLFVANTDNPKNVFLELTACYAFQKRRFIEKTIIVGEGLVGQSFKDADTIYITDVPSNYVDITSGLGGANPRSVLVIPLKLSDRVYGVMELASFEVFERYQIQFLEKLSENIASNLYAVKANEQTKKLLKESTDIAEQMQKQETQMRRNMRILEATQSEMLKNQEALDAQSYAIKSTLVYVEMDINGKILSLNEHALHAFKYSQSDLLNKNHRLLCPNTDVDMLVYDMLWKDLKIGVPVTNEFKRVDKYGNEIWVRATYSPVKDQQGNPYKVIKLGFDITEDKRFKNEFKEQFDAFNRSGILLECDMNGFITNVNSNFLELFGYEKDEIIGREYDDLVPLTEKQSKSYQAFRHKLKQGIYHVGEAQRMGKKGEVIWVEGSFSPIIDVNGQPYKIVEFVQDISQRKQLDAQKQIFQDELQNKEAKLTALLNNADDAIYTINTSCRVSLHNESARKLHEKLGFKMRVSVNILDILPKAHQAQWKGFFDRALQGEKFSLDYAFNENFSADIPRIYLSIYFNPIYDAQKRISGVAIFARDITQRKEREIEFAEFAQKQHTRTQRLVEHQRTQLAQTTEQWQDEKKQLVAELQQTSALYQKNLKENLLWQHTPMALMALSKNFDVVFYNKNAKNLYDIWNFCLQPDYHLPDAFSSRYYFKLKKLLDKALEGNVVEDKIIFKKLKDKNGYLKHKSYSIFYINIQKIEIPEMPTASLLVVAQEITTQVSHYLAHYRPKYKLRKNLQTSPLTPKGGTESPISPLTPKGGIESPTNLLIDNSPFGGLGGFLENKILEEKIDIKENILTPQKQTKSNKKVRNFVPVENGMKGTLNLYHFGGNLCVKTYNQEMYDLFNHWRVCLQPDFMIKDVFSNPQCIIWENELKKVFLGQKIHLQQSFIFKEKVTYKRKIYIFDVVISPIIDENNQCNEVELSLKQLEIQ